MFKRLTRKQFSKIIGEFAEQKTKNEKIWYDELYKLNNRIANAQKKGYTFTAQNVIPKTPSRITQKAIEYIKSIRGVKLYSKADNPINPNVSDTEQYRVAKELAKNEKPYNPKSKDETQAIVTELGKQKEETGELTYTRDIEKPSQSTVSVEPIIEGYDTDTEIETGTKTEPEYDKEYYKRDKEREYDEIQAVEQYDIILNTIFDEIGAFEYRIDNVKLFNDENLKIKTEAQRLVWEMLNGAINEYGRQEIARRLNDEGKVVTDLIKYILYQVYYDPNKTSDRTNQAYDRLRDILFKDDVTTKLKYDFRNEYDI